MSGYENPQAFQNAEIRDAFGIGIREGCAGMTLRDWFAGHAPEPPHTWWGGGGRGPDCAGYAMWNYQYADAMLAARTVPS